MAAAPLFDDGQGLFNFTMGFEIPQTHHSIRQIAEVDRGFRRGNQSVLRQNENREDNNYVQSNKQKEQGQLNETRTDSSIVYDPLHDQTKFVYSEWPPSG